MANFCETEFGENGNDFIRLENGNMAHGLSDGDVLNPDKLRLQHRFAVLQKHCNHILQVVVHFIQRCSLRVGAWESGNKTNEKASLLASLDYR